MTLPAPVQLRIAQVDADLFCNVLEDGQGVLGGKDAGRNEIALRDAVGVAPERHVGDVQQPSRLEVAGVFVENALQHLARRAWSPLASDGPPRLEWGGDTRRDCSRGGS